MVQGENILASPITLKPGVGSSYNNGWRQLWKFFLELFLIGIIAWVISLPSGVSGWIQGAAGAFLTLIVIVYSILILAPIDYGVSYAYLKAARGEKLEIKDMFAGFQNYWNAVLANLLVGVIIVIGLILIIIPGIIFACKLAFVPYLVVDKKMDVIEAVKTSWRMTNGHAWRVFLIGLLAIPIIIAGLICLGVGVIISFMWISAAFASLYHAVDSSATVTVAQPSPIIE
jgi:uncharacterized membrane protein